MLFAPVVEFETRVRETDAFSVTCNDMQQVRRVFMRTLLIIALVMIVAGTVSAQTFNAPAEVVELTGSPASEYSATLTGDMLTVYWTSTRTGGVGGRDIWMATRPNLASPWGTPVNVTELNTTWEEYYISVRSDNLEFIISTNRKSQAAYQADLFVSTRPDVKSKWGTPVEITELNSTVVANTEDDPSLRADGLEIFFTSDRTGGLGAAIWHATRPDWKSAWTAPVVVAEIDTSSTEHSPAISGDGLTLLFASTRTGGTGSSDYYMVTRPDVKSKFGTAVELAEVNSTLWTTTAARPWTGTGSTTPTTRPTRSTAPPASCR